MDKRRLTIQRQQARAEDLAVHVNMLRIYSLNVDGYLNLINASLDVGLVKVGMQFLSGLAGGHNVANKR